MIEIILSSFNQLFNAINIFLQQKDLTLGAILAGVSPFIVLWIKISNEKGKKAKQLLIERRQLQIAFNVNEILEALKVESKWSLQEIGSSHEEVRSYRKLFLLSQAVTILRRKKFMSMLKNILKANLSKKLVSAIVSIGVVSLNKKFGLNISEELVWGILGLSLTHISLQTIIDSIKAWTTSKAVTVIRETVPIIEKVALDPNVTYIDMLPTIKEAYEKINKLLELAKTNDVNVLAVYPRLLELLTSYEHPEPVAVIVEDKVAS